MSPKQKLKLELLKTTPHCPHCGCKMAAVDPCPSRSKRISHAAVLVNHQTAIICFQCKRIEDKKKDFARLPFTTRFVKKFDEYTNILTFFKRLKGKYNKFYWTKVLGRPLNGR